MVDASTQRVAKSAALAWLGAKPKAEPKAEGRAAGAQPTPQDARGAVGPPTPPQAAPDRNLTDAANGASGSQQYAIGAQPTQADEAEEARRQDDFAIRARRTANREQLSLEQNIILDETERLQHMLEVLSQGVHVLLSPLQELLGSYIYIYVYMLSTQLSMFALFPHLALCISTIAAACLVVLTKATPLMSVPA